MVKNVILPFVMLGRAQEGVRKKNARADLRFAFFSQLALHSVFACHYCSSFRRSSFPRKACFPRFSCYGAPLLDASSRHRSGGTTLKASRGWQLLLSTVLVLRISELLETSIHAITHESHSVWIASDPIISQQGQPAALIATFRFHDALETTFRLQTH